MGNVLCSTTGNCQIKETVRIWMPQVKAKDYIVDFDYKYFLFLPLLGGLGREALIQYT